jgi:hypothetical protein
VILNFDTLVNGTAPSDPTPWITLDFKDIATDVVELTITNHLQAAEFTTSVLFNSSIALTAPDFTFVSGKADERK